MRVTCQVTASVVTVLLFVAGAPGAGAVTSDPAASDKCQDASGNLQRQLDTLDRQWASGELSGYNRYAGITMTAGEIREVIRREQQKLADLIGKGDKAVAFAGSSSTSAESIQAAIAQAQSLGHDAQVSRLREALNVWQTAIDRQKAEIETSIQRAQDVLADMERAYQEKRKSFAGRLADVTEQSCEGTDTDTEPPPDCDIAARYDRLKQQIDSLASAGAKLRAYVERPLPEEYEPDIPEICIAGDNATLSYKGFWRQVSDRAAMINSYLGFAAGGAEVFGLAWSALQSAALHELSAAILEMSRGEILSMRDRTVPYRQGLDEYRRLREVQEQAEEAAASLRRHQICTVRRGLPSFYAGYHQVLADAKAIREDAARCGKPRQAIDTGALKRLYSWHHRGALRDTNGPDSDTGWSARGGWLDKGYAGNGKPQILFSVRCD
jgi:hypothetical protein